MYCNSDWQIVNTLGSSGSGLEQYSSVGGIAIDSWNDIYVSDVIGNRILKYKYNGDFISEWIGPGDGDHQLNRPNHISIDQMDNLYVADQNHQQVKQFDSEGTFLRKWGHDEAIVGTGNGEFRSPTAVIVDLNWNLYVADRNNHRIQQFAPVFNDQPTDILLSNNHMNERLPVGSLVGTFEAVDPDEDDSFTFSLVSVEGDDDKDNDQFTIEGNSLLSAAIFDDVVQNSYSIRVRVTDYAGHTFEKTIIININNVNRPPTAIQLYSDNGLIKEGQPVGTIVGTLSVTDLDGQHDTVTFELVDGEGSTDNELFTIGGIDGNELLTAAIFDYYDKRTLHIRIRATDQAGDYFEQLKIIGVEFVNQAPTAITITSICHDDMIDAPCIFAESPKETLIGTLHAVDREVDETFTFDFHVDGVFGMHNDHFKIVNGNQLVTNADYQTIADAAEMFGMLLMGFQVRLCRESLCNYYVIHAYYSLDGYYLIQ